MLALQYRTYGGPEVLSLGAAPEPHAGAGQVRVVVRAASVNPIDWKIRAGYLTPGAEAPDATSYLGFDAAGVVDEVGDGVTDVAVGDDVFGLGQHTNSEFAVLNSWVRKPASVDWSVAAAAGVAAETAIRVFGLLRIGPGSTVFIDGGAGGVGAVAVQIGVARGATVIASASETNQDYLREIKAIPVGYGDGVVERVRAAAPNGLDGVFDVAGKTPIADLVSLVPAPSQVVSIANFTVGEAGARVTSGGEGDPKGALTETADLLEHGKLVIKVQTFPFDRAAQAHEISQSGHVRGKLVLVW